MATPNVGPSRAGYVLAIAILIASLIGCAALVVLFVLAILGISSGFQRVIIPQGGEVTLNQPGHYTIFYEFHSEIAGQVFNTSTQLPSLTVTVRQAGAPAAPDLPLSPVSVNTNYTTMDRAGYAVWTFDVTQPGAYRIDGAYADPAELPRVLAVGRGVAGKIGWSIAYLLAGILLAIAGTITAIVIFVITLVRRQSAQSTPLP